MIQRRIILFIALVAAAIILIWALVPSRPDCKETFLDTSTGELKYVTFQNGKIISSEIEQTPLSQILNKEERSQRIRDWRLAFRKCSNSSTNTVLGHHLQQMRVLAKIWEKDHVPISQMREDAIQFLKFVEENKDFVVIEEMSPRLKEIVK